MAASSRLTEIANPAAVGWSWTDGETEYQVVWSRGTRGLRLGMRAQGGEWFTTGMDEVWSHDGTLAGARASAQRFFDKGSEQVDE